MIRAVALFTLLVTCQLGSAQPLPEPTRHLEDNPIAIPIAETPKPTSQSGDVLRRAATMFNQARESDATKFAEAGKLFEQAQREKEKFTPEQQSAWAYCRIKVATDRLNANADAVTAADVLTEIEDALGTVPNQLNLHQATRDILALARKRAGTSGGKPETKLAAVSVVEPGWQVEESASFRIRHRNNKALATNLLSAAETIRETVFKKWSGPSGGAWTPKCDIVLHPKIEDFTKATTLPATATGRAEVKMSNGTAASRRIDLRADDDTISEAALPRELTHILLADLFPSQSPPKWAELGMAVLSTSDSEVNRYLRTVRRCAKDGELLPIDKILGASDVPAKAVTEFHVESVALVDYLVRWKGEKLFTAFLRDAQRYGYETGLKRQYGLNSAKQLEDSWRRGSLPETK